ncbi:MAG: FMN-binding negative transcriptional regulator [Actinomycetota bacterium]|jgi:transcriptional regulator|nr:FMN-binding negative transcriptional regulator [Actinomycetota bacterium]
MYAAPHFREERPEVLLEAIRAIGAITLVTPTTGDLHATFLPVLVESTADESVLVGHIAKANSQWRDADSDQLAMAIAAGPNTYVTPNHYPSKIDDPRVAPTWNYVHVQAHGRVEWIDDHHQKLAIVTALTDHHESSQPEPWAVSDAPDDFVETKVRGIVGLRFHIVRLEGTFKLSQNQTEQNRAGVLAGLSADHSSAAASVAEAMRSR